MRLRLVAMLCAAAVALTGCFVVGAERDRGPVVTPSAETTSPGTPDNFGPPFSRQPAGFDPPGRALALELSRIDEPLSLPATGVAGAADAAYAGPREHPRGIWIHYPTGIFLSIQKEEFDARRLYAEVQSTGYRNADGSAHALLERINGRDTLIFTEGALADRDGDRLLHTKPGPKRLIQWSQRGWHYSLQPNGPRAASLALMRDVAESMP